MSNLILLMLGIVLGAGGTLALTGLRRYMPAARNRRIDDEVEMRIEHIVIDPPRYDCINWR